MTGHVCVVGGGYGVNRAGLSAPKGDTAVARFSLYDENMQEFDTGDVAAAVFYVGEGQVCGGTMYAGGEQLFTLSLGSGIAKAADLYTLVVTIPSDKTEVLENIWNYFELVITLNNGQKYTVSSGVLVSPRTMRADGY